MNTYVKLFSDILHSTIWQKEAHTRLVWVTMLAMCDREGQVGASVPGLARMAGVGVNECEEALEYLSSPDKRSRTQEYEGRRIAEIDGGWLVLNYRKYRDLRNADEVRESVRNRVRKCRERKKNGNTDVTNVTHVTECNGMKPPEAVTEAETETETEEKRVKTSMSTSRKTEADLVVAKKKNPEILEVFAHYRERHPRSHPKPKSTSKEWRAIKARLAEGYDVERLCQAIDGMHITPHNLGDNERGQKYLSLELCMRSGDQVDRFAETQATGPPRPRHRETENERIMREVNEHNARVDERQNPGVVFDSAFELTGAVPIGEN